MEQITRDEFARLGAALAKKVDLFQDAWVQDEKAELFGGTTRDFLYWIKGQFKDVHTRAEAEAKMRALEGLPRIAVRDFMMADSDADIVGNASLDIRDYGLRKLDLISNERFDPESEAGKNELGQGYIPVEKIRLGRNGWIPWPGFGDGIGEIYSGRPTVHFTDAATFKDTKYAQDNENHEILLAVRYVRQLAMNYFREHGKDLPDKEKLFDVDPDSFRAVKDVIARASGPLVLQDHFRSYRFGTWLNKAIEKAFRSYTNPTATHLLFRELGLDHFVEVHAGNVKPINQYLFAKYRDASTVEKNLTEFNVDRAAFFLAPESRLPGLKLFHGTRTEEAFRSILFQGILPSESGVGGPGLYGVPEKDIKFAETWGRSNDRVVVLDVSPHAKVVDITEGEGKRIFDRFGKSEDEFAEFFGVDIIRYPYGATEAYVVKNGGVLTGVKGHARRLLSFGELLTLAQQADTKEKAVAFLKILDLNAPKAKDNETLLRSLPDPEIVSHALIDLFSAEDPAIAKAAYERRALIDVSRYGVKRRLVREATSGTEGAKWRAIFLLAERLATIGDEWLSERLIDLFAGKVAIASDALKRLPKNAASFDGVRARLEKTKATGSMRERWMAALLLDRHAVANGAAPDFARVRPMVDILAKFPRYDAPRNDDPERFGQVEYDNDDDLIDSLRPYLESEPAARAALIHVIDTTGNQELRQRIVRIFKEEKLEQPEALRALFQHVVVTTAEQHKEAEASTQFLLEIAERRPWFKHLFVERALHLELDSKGETFVLQWNQKAMEGLRRMKTFTPEMMATLRKGLDTEDPMAAAIAASILAERGEYDDKIERRLEDFLVSGVHRDRLDLVVPGLLKAPYLSSEIRSNLIQRATNKNQARSSEEEGDGRAARVLIAHGEYSQRVAMAAWKYWVWGNGGRRDDIGRGAYFEPVDPGALISLINQFYDHGDLRTLLTEQSAMAIHFYRSELAASKVPTSFLYDTLRGRDHGEDRSTMARRPLGQTLRTIHSARGRCTGFMDELQ